jgi:phospholipid-transporting ATPase
VSPTGRFTTAVPLSIILLVSAIKEIYEDIKRRRMDGCVNSYRAEVIENGGVITKRWRDMNVGEIVKVTNNEVIPADLVVISTSETQGIG